MSPLDVMLSLVELDMKHMHEVLVLVCSKCLLLSGSLWVVHVKLLIQHKITMKKTKTNANKVTQFSTSPMILKI